MHLLFALLECQINFFRFQNDPVALVAFLIFSENIIKPAHESLVSLCAEFVLQASLKLSKKLIFESTQLIVDFR